MRSAVLMLGLAAVALATPSFGRGLVAEGGGLALTPEDYRMEVRNLSPSYEFDGSYDDRKILVDLLAARFFLAESAMARGYGDEGLAEAGAAAEAEAVGKAYRTWRIEKAVRVPRVESKQVLEKLDRKLRVKEMVFGEYADAARALARLDRGETFDEVAASLAGTPGVMVLDPGLRIWKEFDRSVAIRVFDLVPGETTGILRSNAGHVICHLAEDVVWGEAKPELLTIRSRRIIRWQREADIEQEVRRDLSRRYRLEFNAEGIRAGVEAFKLALAGQMPPEALLGAWAVRYQGHYGEQTVLNAELFSTYWAMQPNTQPYVGDAHALREFALDVILPGLEAAAGYDLGLDRLRSVAWNAKKAREDFLIPKMEELLKGAVALAPGEVEAYYQQHRAEMMTKMQYRIRRILVGSTEEADRVLAELRTGRDFAQVAAERSIDPGTAGRGGEVGLVTAGMFKLYDSLAVALRVGETSGPHTTSDGVEMIRLEERIEPRPLRFEDARAYLEQAALEAKTNRILSGWVEARKAECGFRIDRDLLAAVELPEPDWKASMVRESAAEDEPAGIESAPGAGSGTEEDGKPEAGPKPRAGRRRMIKKQG